MPGQQLEALSEGGCFPSVSLLQTSPHPATDQVLVKGFMRLKIIIQNKALPEDGEHLVEAAVNSSTTALEQRGGGLPSALCLQSLGTVYMSFLEGRGEQ